VEFGGSSATDPDPESVLLDQDPASTKPIQQPLVIQKEWFAALSQLVLSKDPKAGETADIDKVDSCVSNASGIANQLEAAGFKDLADSAWREASRCWNWGSPYTIRALQLANLARIPEKQRLEVWGIGLKDVYQDLKDASKQPKEQSPAAQFRLLPWVIAQRAKGLFREIPPSASIDPPQKLIHNLATTERLSAQLSLLCGLVHSARMEEALTVAKQMQSLLPKGPGGLSVDRLDLEECLRGLSEHGHAAEALDIAKNLHQINDDVPDVAESLGARTTGSQPSSAPTAGAPSPALRFVDSGNFRQARLWAKQSAGSEAGKWKVYYLIVRRMVERTGTLH
jgi:hypothetical protein